MTWGSDLPPRSDHGDGPAWLNASEWEDTSSVLQRKVRLLAELLKLSRKSVLYTGAGISTAAGVRDYATKSRTFAFGDSPLDAEPTFAHRALAALHAAGLLHDWVQQNQ